MHGVIVTRMRHVAHTRARTMQDSRYDSLDTSLFVSCCLLLFFGLSLLRDCPSSRCVSLVALGFPCCCCVLVAFDCVLTLTFHAMKCMELACMQVHAWNYVGHAVYVV